jgi:hypothetical protein
MGWRQGPQDFSRLNQLGNLTARLIRLAAFDKLKRGDAQLQSYGLPTTLGDTYKEHALSERYILIPQKPKNLEPRVIVTETDTSEF